MAAEIAFLSSACFLYLVVQGATESKRPSDLTYMIDIPPDFHQRVREFEDVIKVVESPTYATPEFDVVVSYRCNAARLLTFEVSTIGINGREKLEYRKEVYILVRTEETETEKFHVKMRDSLVFGENRALGVFPDLHTDRVLVVAALTELGVQGKADAVDKSDHQYVLLIPPSRRPQKPGYSFPWVWQYWLAYGERTIRRCHALNDVIDFVSFPLALNGRNDGVKRVISPLTWPEEGLAEVDSQTKPRFTITSWVFIQEHCHGANFCGILHHRKKEFMTPMLALTPTGQIHVQLHYEDYTGHAFDINAELPLNTWIQLVLAVNETLVHVFYRYGNNLDKRAHFVHDSDPFYYQDTDGYWVVGGTEGLPSFKGFIGHTRIYRRHVLTPEQVFIPSENHPMFIIGLDEHFTRCSETVTKLYEALSAEDAQRSLENDRCMAQQRTLTDLIQQDTNKLVPYVHCQATVSGETPEVDLLVLRAMRKNFPHLEDSAESVYQLALEKLSQGSDEAELALGLLRVSSCMSHPASLYTMAVMLVTGLGRVHHRVQAFKYLLIGASNNHALSQMSLGYKHLLGVDGVNEADCDVALGYYKAAARTTDKLIELHQDIHTHSEAVRLDDYDELANHRTSNADLFQWIIHQASRGITDAQNIIGDMYFYGTRGLQRDVDLAVQYYEMGAQQGDPEGLFNLGISALRGQGMEKNEEEAMRLIGLSAEQGFPPALNAMGFYEVNMRQNFSGGAIYFRMAADKGDRDGLFNLGVAYDNGWVAEEKRNKLAAYKYWFEAANKGHPGAILSVGEGVSSGEYIDRNCPLGVVYLRFLAEQHPTIGRYLRRGLEAYYDGNLYQSLVFFLLAGEAGMELPQYNAALLCQENQKLLTSLTVDNCAWRYYNSSAGLGWVYSMLKLGDFHWYGWSVPQNLTAAAEMYGKAAAKNDHPQALYNLAYMVEHNLPLKGVNWKNIYKHDDLQGNLTFATSLYRNCRDSLDHNNESFLPCAWGVMRVTLKQFWNDRSVLILVFLVGVGVFVGFVSGRFR